MAFDSISEYELLLDNFANHTDCQGKKIRTQNLDYRYYLPPTHLPPSLPYLVPAAPSWRSPEWSLPFYLDTDIHRDVMGGYTPSLLMGPHTGIAP